MIIDLGIEERMELNLGSEEMRRKPVTCALALDKREMKETLYLFHMIHAKDVSRR